MSVGTVKGEPTVGCNMSENALGKAVRRKAERVLNVPDSQTHMCPKCGDMFDNLKGLNLHHANLHGGSIRRLWTTCKYCQGRYQTVVSQVVDHGSSFCSKECQSKHQESWVGERSPSWKGGRLQIDCDYCGECFERKPSLVKDSEFNYCSRDCYASHKSRLVSGKNSPNWGGGKSEWVCDHCGSEFRQWESQIKDTESPYCSVQCADIGSAKSGQDHPGWNGGKGLTDAIRKNVSERSWERCRIKYYEDNRKKCEKCGSGENIQLHHIIPIRGGGSNGEWNLMPLCPSCHRTVESYTLNEIQEVIL